MDRLACVDVPALALQLLIRRHRDWSACPAAVVAADTPQGEVLAVNARARDAGVLPGLRYAPALALCPELRAGTVPGAEIERGVAELTEQLRRFTPEIEPSADLPGVFWLNAAGLGRLHRTPKRWATAIRDDLARTDLVATIAVGFTRFGSYALARASQRSGVIVLGSSDQEATAARRVPLSRLDLPPSVRDDLRRLGVTTVGGLVALPAAGVLERYGTAAHRLRQLAAGDLWAPLDPMPAPEPIVEQAQLDHADDNAMRLTFLAKRLLHPLLAEVAARHSALGELEIGLALDHRPDRVERIKPAAPTLDERQLIDLVRLRFEAIDLDGGVIEVVLVAHPVPATIDQLELFANGQRRELAAADRAFARLRAEFGDDAVVRARLADGHLPEARFVWERLEHLTFPKNHRPVRGQVSLQAFATPIPDAASHTSQSSIPAPQAPPGVGGEKENKNERPGRGEVCRTPGGAPPPTQADSNGEEIRTLVRRIHARPIPLVTRPVRGPGGVHLRGMGGEPVIKVTGPYITSGGWWSREIHREYHFAETKDGQLLWVYFDRRRRRWFVHGSVE